MGRYERVAVLDVRSCDVTFLIGAKGVNDTFAFCGSKSEKYDGFSTQGFFEEDDFRRAVVSVVSSVMKNYEGKLDKVFVGVPAPFVSIKTKGHTVAFPKKRKIGASDIDALYESGLSDLMSSGRCIKRSAMYFALGDNRKYFETDKLYHTPTSTLKGALCYYLVSDEFYSLVSDVLKKLGFSTVSLLPVSLAESVYLLPQKAREGYAFLLDIGFTVSTVSVVYGNGIVHEQSFDAGVASILVSLMENLGVEYEKAEEILASANIAGGRVPSDLMWMDDNGASYSVARINDVIKYGLDQLCESVHEFFDLHYKDKTVSGFMVNPLSLTGEGVSAIAGVAEHVSKRLSRITEIVAPDLPYYDKTECSSKISLLAAAIEESPKTNIFTRLFKGARK
jgi:cell division ATPase FtsA